MEIYKDIPWYEWLYQASNLWQIKSLWNSKKRKEKILKLQDIKWYKRVKLFSYWWYEKILVHRLVMMSFVWYSNLQVNHINHNTSDNRLENLEYLTPKENCNKKKVHLIECPNCNHCFYNKKRPN